MARRYQCFRLRTVRARQRDFQFDFNAEAIGDLTDADTDIDGDVLWQGDLVARANELHRPDEACAISRREELLGVRSVAASAAELLRRGQLEIEVAVGNRRASVATAGDARVSGCAVSSGRLLNLVIGCFPTTW